jgi:hypothetical protein
MGPSSPASKLTWSRSSRAFGRDVAFEEARPEHRSSGATAEEYWPDMAGLDYRDTVTDFEMPAGTFFDIAVVHLLTTATINHLRALYPQGRFEVRRFRPNIVVSTGSSSDRQRGLRSVTQGAAAPPGIRQRRIGRIGVGG